MRPAGVLGSWLAEAGCQPGFCFEKPRFYREGSVPVKRIRCSAWPPYTGSDARTRAGAHAPAGEPSRRLRAGGARVLQRVPHVHDDERRRARLRRRGRPGGSRPPPHSPSPTAHSEVVEAPFRNDLLEADLGRGPVHADEPGDGVEHALARTPGDVLADLVVEGVLRGPQALL